ncbi:MAG: hypothetical protein J6S14_17265 [Clostridia bacterium]|nr:hypothetical protein [Clostridia bacterium]
MKKITVNQMNEAMAAREYEGRYIRIPLGDVEIVLDTELSFDDVQTFVDRVSSAVVNEGGYFPAVRDVVFFATALQMMSNVNVPTRNTDVTGETTKVLDLKKLQEWLYALGEDWNRCFYGAECRNLIHLDVLVDMKIDRMLQMQQVNTPMQEFFRKAMDAIDNLSSEHGIGMAELAGMMTPQVANPVQRSKVIGAENPIQMQNVQSAEQEDEELGDLQVGYAEDGTMMF